MLPPVRGAAARTVVAALWTIHISVMFGLLVPAEWFDVFSAGPQALAVVYAFHWLLGLAALIQIYSMEARWLAWPAAVFALPFFPAGTAAGVATLHLLRRELDDPGIKGLPLSIWERRMLSAGWIGLSTLLFYATAPGRTMPDWAVPKFLLALTAVVLIHETGHVLAGLLCGYRLDLLSAMIVEYRRAGEPKLRWATVPDALGYCGMTPSRDAGREYLFYLSGGILANIATGIAVWLYAAGDSPLLTFFLMVSGIMVLSSLLPFETGSVESDGKRLARCLRNPKALQLDVTIGQCWGELAGQMPPKAWPREWAGRLEQADYLEPGGIQALGLLCLHYEDGGGSREQLIAAIERHRSAWQSLSYVEARQTHAVDLIWYAGRYLQDVDLVREAMPLVEERPAAFSDLAHTLVCRAVIQQLVERDTTLARSLLRQACSKRSADAARVDANAAAELRAWQAWEAELRATEG